MQLSESCDNTKQRVALTIAGSDSGGGAGYRFYNLCLHCVHGTSALTHNGTKYPGGDTGWCPPAAVVAQIQTVVQDTQAVKTGMLLNQEIITAVAEQVEALGIDNR